MSEIKVGDLVVVIRPTTCCANHRSVGLIFMVTQIGTAWWLCPYCRATGDQSLDALTGHGGWVELTRLKRIPPLEELDDVKREEEIHV